jgi:hypothetical protein
MKMKKKTKHEKKLEKIRTEIYEHKEYNFDSYLAMVISQHLATFVMKKSRVHGDTRNLEKDLLKAHKIFERYMIDSDEVTREETDEAFKLLADHFHRLWI